MITELLPNYDLKVMSEHGSCRISVSDELSKWLGQIHCQLEGDRTLSFLDAAHDNILRAGGWSAFVKDHSSTSDSDVLASFIGVRAAPVRLALVEKHHPSWNEPGNITASAIRPEHLTPAADLYRLLRRSLELEVFEGLHNDLCRGLGEEWRTEVLRQKTPALAVRVLTILLALRSYFGALQWSPPKRRVGALCKRLYSYFCIFNNKWKTLDEEVFRNFFWRSTTTADVWPLVDRLDAFYKFMGVSEEWARWWEQFPEGEDFPPQR
ncbi:uncharacterized protein DNG_00340 [Cephalotrichum gorgonifer]|uniref:Uncharacterized protein n=1 Tax=Cephalotrichum gorgonifer TaxID=2041049 RepID=A0AAE8MNS8_9PEZI|nr:uncharacterized protein DNG_00340 [Cephalotrichum gorgonifer]